LGRNNPVKVVWRDSLGKTRTASFLLIPQGQKKARALKSEGLSPSVYVQGELFERAEDGGAKAYDPRYEIPF